MSPSPPEPIDLGDLSSMTPIERRERIISVGAELGFAHVGICTAAPTEHADDLRAWLEAGRHGSMHYLAERVEAMLDPGRVLEGCRTVICVADRYHGGRDRIIRDGTARGRVARYARGRDYHDVLRRRLKRLAAAITDAAGGHEARGVVDTAPLLEREYAARAGLGLVGKNTLMIRPGEGSWFLLGEVLTTLEIATDRPLTAPDPCGTCTRCIDACPTGAITPFSVDATRCLAYTTIEHRAEVDPSLHEATGDWLFGCDVCQEVCPHNQPTRRKREAHVAEAYAQRRTGFELLEVLDWTEEDRREAFTTSAMKRAKLDMFKRNALICAGNVLRKRDDPVLRARIEAISVDPDEPPLVTRTACTVLGALDSS